MTIHLDTSALIDALSGRRRALDALVTFTEQGHRFGLSTIVLYEWRRGPRTRAELSAQDELFPAADAVPFGPAEALEAARLYRHVTRPRGRDVDLAIAACALSAKAALWTLNVSDFSDIPGLTLV